MKPFVVGEDINVRMGANTLQEREMEVLRELASFCRSADANPDWHPQWAKPMDVGGRDGSHHSYTLAKLARREPPLVERRQRGMFAQSDQRGFLRGSWEYRITERGKAVAAW